jgi:hypothetical protein
VKNKIGRRLKMQTYETLALKGERRNSQNGTREGFI